MTPTTLTHDPARALSLSLSLSLSLIHEHTGETMGKWGADLDRLITLSLPPPSALCAQLFLHRVAKARGVETGKDGHQHGKNKAGDIGDERAGVGKVCLLGASCAHVHCARKHM
jgi:hypothetical protein